MAENGPLLNGKSSKTGKFLAGNQLARGRSNPYAKALTVWRAELYAAIEPGDIRCVIRKLITEARNGRGWAIRELLDRCFGKPAIYAEIGGPGAGSLDLVRAAAQAIVEDAESCEIAVKLADRQAVVAEQDGSEVSVLPILPGGDGDDGNGNGQEQVK